MYSNLVKHLVSNSLDLPPLQHLQPRGREVLFGLGSVFPHSNTPSLCVAGFDDEDEDEAPFGTIRK